MREGDEGHSGDRSNEDDATDGGRAGGAGATTRRTLLGALGAGLVGTAAAGVAGAEGSGYTKIDRLDVRSWDGTTIAASLYEPDAAGPHPAMLMTHGWGNDRSSADGVARLFAEHGYVVLTYDSRGFGESGGEVGVDGPKEVMDVSALIDWLADWSSVRADGDNPDVGMIGISYAGGIQINAAARDDRLDAIVPIIPWYDLVFSLAPNGVIKRNWDLLLYASGIAGSRGLSSGDGQPSREDFENGVAPKEHETILESTVTNDMPDSSKAWFEVRSPSQKIDAIAASDTPTLTIEGWSDTLFVPNQGVSIFQGLRERGAESKLILFDAGHTLKLLTDPASQKPQFEAAYRYGLQFAEAHVRGEGDDGLAPVTMHESQTGEWQRAQQFPPRRARERTLHLSAAANRSDGQTPVVNSVAATSTSQLFPRDVDLAEGATAVNFDFPVAREVEVVGTPRLSAEITPLGRTTDLFAKLKHVDAAGDATLIDNQAMPYEIEGTDRRRVAFDLVSLQRHLQSGETLRLTIASTDAGFFGARQSAGALIHHSADAPATLTLPAVGPTGAFAANRPGL
ncbi:MAG: CocE/NonD family hydrolase [Haloarculaceae archaeon]